MNTIKDFQVGQVVVVGHLLQNGELFTPCAVNSGKQRCTVTIQSIGRKVIKTVNDKGDLIQGYANTDDAGMKFVFLPIEEARAKYAALLEKFSSSNLTLQQRESLVQGLA